MFFLILRSSLQVFLHQYFFAMKLKVKEATLYVYFQLIFIQNP